MKMVVLTNGMSFDRLRYFVPTLLAHSWVVHLATHCFYFNRRLIMNRV